MPTWLITGCSTGLGRHLAKAGLERGYNAVVTARDANTVRDLAEYLDIALALLLDVTDQVQVTNGVNQAEERFGSEEGPVNNAGYGYRAAVEEGEEEAVAQLFATNFFGPVAMIKAVLPSMRRTQERCDRQHLLDRRAYLPARLRVLLGLEVCRGGNVRGASRRSRTARHHGDRGRTWRISNRLRRSFVTAGPRAHRRLRRHGRASAQGARHLPRTQPGDPARAAEAIITAVEAKDPPFLLLLGKDACDAFQAVLDAQGKELADWRELSLGTGFPD